MNDDMTCYCRTPEISETDIRFAQKFGLDPGYVHRFNDEWMKVAGEVVRERRKNASTPGRDQG